jgi:intein/homing endonuclease
MVMTESGEKPISELIGTKGRAWSYNTKTGTKELKPYFDCRLTQKQAKIFKIKLSDGRLIRCTEDHPILTERGYIKAKDLNSTDRIIDIS